MKLVGHLVNSPDGRSGERGSGYNYVLAGNGLFLEGNNGLLDALIPLAEVPVRGLPPLAPHTTLVHGKIPAVLLPLAMNHMWSYPDEELYLAIVWDGYRYALKQPAQERSATHVTYQVVPQTVVSLHSHGRMRAFFSGTDDMDERGLLVSVVVGDVRTLSPESQTRVCAYGYFAPIDSKEIFEGWVPLRTGGDASSL